MTYDVDHESFVLQVTRIPSTAAALPLARAMLDATRKIESALVQKLNCMYFISRKISLPSIEGMLKRERLMDDKGKAMYFEFSKLLNQLINSYFAIENEGKFKSVPLPLLTRNNFAQRTWRSKLLATKKRETT
jgi:hypothetical protein